MVIISILFSNNFGDQLGQNFYKKVCYCNIMLTIYQRCIVLLKTHPLAQTALKLVTQATTQCSVPNHRVQIPDFDNNIIIMTILLRLYTSLRCGGLLSLLPMHENAKCVFNPPFVNNIKQNCPGMGVLKKATACTILSSLRVN